MIVVQIFECSRMLREQIDGVIRCIGHWKPPFRCHLIETVYDRPEFWGQLTGQRVAPVDKQDSSGDEQAEGALAADWRVDWRLA